MDADLSHRPDDLKNIVRALSQQKVVIGSRYIKGGGTENWSLSRRVISQAGSFYARTILRIPVRDLTGGFNGWHRSVIEAINPDDIRSEGYTFQVELKFRARLAGFYLHEVPILFVERRVGQSKMSGGIIWEAIIRTWLLALARQSIKQRIAERS
jgi:dolichol-phosphate mannosyltransferase